MIIFNYGTLINSSFKLQTQDPRSLIQNYTTHRMLIAAIEMFNWQLAKALTTYIICFIINVDRSLM